MSIFDFLFKKKKEEPVNTIENMVHNLIIVKEDDGTTRTEEYILAKDICPHLKVAGTKYYHLKSNESSVRNIELFLRCRYSNSGKKSIREPLGDLLKLNPAVVSSANNSDYKAAFDLEILLKENIDYILIDKNENTGDIFYYYSFKGVLDKNGETIEGYIVVNSKEDKLVDYLSKLI